MAPIPVQNYFRQRWKDKSFVHLSNRRDASMNRFPGRLAAGFVAAGILAVGLAGQADAATTGTMRIAGTCFAGYEYEHNDNGVYLVVRPHGGCTTAATLTCTAYTGQTLTTTGGPVSEVLRLTLQGQPSPKDLYGCSGSAQLTDPVSKQQAHIGFNI
ncbi:hypothetical protein [Amycolatopsis sp. NPDC004169]|uniref:hypothetical protein n=1 Tax=Amycolatopsis sp. NPDC004169 TaxID=3154453 RepID=UPI0033BC97CF